MANCRLSRRLTGVNAELCLRGTSQRPAGNRSTMSYLKETSRTVSGRHGQFHEKRRTRGIMATLALNPDDEVLDDADALHEEQDADVQLGKRIAKKEKYHALDYCVAGAEALDIDCVTSAPEHFGTNAEAIAERDLSGEAKDTRASAVGFAE